MRRIWVCLTALLLAGAWTGAAYGQAGKPQNVVLFGWDGAQREHVKECLERGELPTLKTLAAEGKMVDIDIRGTTDTKAGWSQILTGYDPNVTGVFSNSQYQPVPEGLSVFDRLKEHFGADKIACVAVIGKKGHCGEIDPPKKVKLTDEEAAQVEAIMKVPQKNRRRDKMDDQEWAALQQARKGQFEPDIGSKVVEEGGVKYLVTPGKPYMNMSKVCDVWEFGLMQDAKVGSRAIELLEKYKDKPFFFFVHFAEVDHKGHSFGENSKEYNDALISNDTWTGKIIAKLKELGLYDKTTVYVTADHGFDEDKMGHQNAPRVFLATNDKGVVRNGDRADVTPTILEKYGLDLRNLSRKCVTATQPGVKDPPLAGHPLTKPLPEWKTKQRQQGRGSATRPGRARAGKAK